MAQSQVAIIGTGLIGTSVGLALQGIKSKSFEIVGADRDRQNARTAKKLGALDREVGSIEEAVGGAGLIIVAVPVIATRRLFEQMAPFVKPGTIITDTCSTKADVMAWADELLPDHIHFVGGHPMAGKEKSGPDAATADLFKNATWAVTPARGAASEAVSVILNLVESLGANPMYIDPAEHDQYAAAISHLPIAISVALFRMVRDSHGWEDAGLLAGPAFRDLTRLASGDPIMSADIMETNREAVVHWIDRFRDELATVKIAIELGGQPLIDLFSSTSLDRDTFILNPMVRRRPEGPEAPSSQDAIGRLFVGGLYDKLKDLSNRSPEVKRADDRELRKKLGVPDDDRRR